MKVVLFMATSLNGMIATKDGKEDFLSHENWKSFVSIANKIGNFVVGRRTYDTVKNWNEGYGFDDFSELDRVIVSSNSSLVVKNYLTATSAKEVVDKLQQKGHEIILVTGGSGVNTLFVDYIDEVWINIEPVLVGAGVPLFKETDFTLRLKLFESIDIGEGILQLRYKVLK